MYAHIYNNKRFEKDEREIIRLNVQFFYYLKQAMFILFTRHSTHRYKKKTKFFIGLVYNIIWNYLIVISVQMIFVKLHDQFLIDVASKYIHYVHTKRWSEIMGGPSSLLLSELYLLYETNEIQELRSLFIKVYFRCVRITFILFEVTY